MVKLMLQDKQIMLKGDATVVAYGTANIKKGSS